MFGQLLRNWWIPVVRGVLGIIFGILVIANPNTAVTFFVYMFGAYMLVDGLAALGFAFDVSRGRGWMILSGIAGIAAGILTFIYPSATALVLVSIAAAWAIVTGIFELVAAIEWRRLLPDAWMLGLGGVFSIILGVVLFASPGTGLLAWAWLIGSYAVVYGVLYIVTGLRLKSLQRPQSAPSH